MIVVSFLLVDIFFLLVRSTLQRFYKPFGNLTYCAYKNGIEQNRGSSGSLFRQKKDRSTRGGEAMTDCLTCYVVSETDGG